MNTPNKLTLLRMIMVPFFIAALYLDFNIAALIIFIAASFTDYLDGHLARKNKLVTNFGKLMDPLADKILTISALVCFLEMKVPYLYAWMVVIIISREFLVTGIRMIALGDGKVIAASMWGKAKTVSQLAAIIAIMADRIEPLSFGNFHLTQVLVIAAVVLTVYSGFDYVKKNLSLLDFK